MTREEIKKAMRDTKKEVVLKNLHKLLSLVEGYPEYEDSVGYAIETLEQEPKTGEWIKQNDDYYDWYECSDCGYGSDGEMQYSSEYDVRTNYCPNCGARMVEPQESEDAE